MGWSHAVHRMSRAPALLLGGGQLGSGFDIASRRLDIEWEARSDPTKAPIGGSNPKTVPVLSQMNHPTHLEGRRTVHIPSHCRHLQDRIR